MKNKKYGRFIIITILAAFFSFYLSKTYSDDYQVAILNDNGTNYLSVGTKNNIKKEIKKDSDGNYHIKLNKKEYSFDADIKYSNLDDIYVNNKKIKTYKMDAIKSKMYDNLVFFDIKNDNSSIALFLLVFIIIESLLVFIYKNIKIKNVFKVIKFKHIIISFIVLLLTMFFVTGCDARVITDVLRWFSRDINIYQLQVNTKNLLNITYVQFPYNPISLISYGLIFKIFGPIINNLPVVFGFQYLHIFFIKIINWLFINITILSIISYIAEKKKISEKKKVLLYYLSFFNPITFYVAFLFVQIDALSLMLLTLGFLNIGKINEDNYSGLLYLLLGIFIKLQLLIIMPIALITIVIVLFREKNVKKIIKRLITIIIISLIVFVLSFAIHYIIKTPFNLIVSNLEQAERIYYTLLPYMGTISLMISVLLIGLSLYSYAFNMKSTINDFDLTKINLFYLMILVFALSASIVPTPSIYVLSLPFFVVLFAEEKDWYRILMIYIMSIGIVVLPMLSDYGNITYMFSLTHKGDLLSDFISKLSDASLIKFYNIVFSVSTVSMIAYIILGIKEARKILDSSK